MRRRLAVGACAALAGSLTACSSDSTPPVEPPARTELSTPPTESGPVIGAWHELVYAPAASAVLLVNGAPEGVRAPEPLELWSWDGASWSLVVADPDGPTARNYAAVAYDTDRGVLVVHGGIGPTGDELGETLEWDGTDWRVLDTGGPGPRNAAAMAYDDDRDVAVLYGGDSGGVIHGDTWEWDGSTWSRAASEGPTPPRWPAIFEPDATTGAIVLYGGHQVADPATPPSLADTWVWSDGAWRLAEQVSAPGLLVNAAGAFDPDRGAVIMAGGSDLGEPNGAAWEWSDNTWTMIRPDAFPARQGHGMAYDIERDVFVVTGGVVTPGGAERHQEVWEWDGQSAARQRAMS